VVKRVSIGSIWTEVARIHLKRRPIRPILVFMDPSSTIQSAGSQATGIIGIAIVLSIFVMALKLATPARKRVSID
jgi:hypothetical protein